MEDDTAQMGLNGLYMLREDVRSKKAGVLKKGKSALYRSTTQKFLDHNQIVFDPNLFTCTLSCEEEHHTLTDQNKKTALPDANNAIQYVQFELLRIGWDDKKHKYHGKWNGQNDDSAIATQMLVYWMTELLKPGSDHAKLVRQFQHAYVYRPDATEKDERRMF